MTLPKTRSICIHGHFYQPPRENPWLEEIEAQDSARPWHDWNQRIEEECYTANTYARILDEQGRLARIINNYEYISFDFGPTLLTWLEKHSPRTYQSILDADAVSRTARSGHGNAIAQAYHHIIMPLASTRDKVTEVLWGIQDFRHRFGRDPEGMWLPETAVDRETLEILVDNGIRFTILAPGQAHKFRATSEDKWVEVGPGSIDPTQPYLCHLSNGRTIALFFYDGPISQAIAFQRLLNSGEELRKRLLKTFSDTRTWSQLVNIATDGESYGHHHRFGEMALAYALSRMMQDETIQLTNYGEFLENHPATAEVEIVENTAWSCAHGLGRWSEDCGCSQEQRAGWNQKWRTPLRNCMNLLRDRVDRIFENVGAPLLGNVWAARNDYVQVILSRRDNIKDFLDRHKARDLDEEQKAPVLELLEMQRNRIMIFTSCGWFFDDIQGIETQQILRYAARVLELATPFDSHLKDDFLLELSETRSNQRPHMKGNEIFEQMIAPQVTNLARVAADIAIASVFENFSVKGRYYYYDVELHDYAIEKNHDRVFLVGRTTVFNGITTRRSEFVFSLLYLGGVDLRCSVKEMDGIESYNSLKVELMECSSKQSSTDLVRLMDKHFPAEYFSFRDLFEEHRSGIVESVIRKMHTEQESLFEEFYNKNKEFTLLMPETMVRVPDTFLAVASFVLNRRLETEIEKLKKGEFPDELEDLLDEAQFWKIKLDVAAAAKLMGSSIAELVERLANDPWNRAIPQDIVRLLSLSHELAMSIDLSAAQVALYNIIPPVKSEDRGLPPGLVELAEKLRVRLDGN